MTNCINQQMMEQMLIKMEEVFAQMIVNVDAAIVRVFDRVKSDEKTVEPVEFSSDTHQILVEEYDEAKDICKPEQLSSVQEPNQQPPTVGLSLVNFTLRKRDQVQLTKLIKYEEEGKSLVSLGNDNSELAEQQLIVDQIPRHKVISKISNIIDVREKFDAIYSMVFVDEIFVVNDPYGFRLLVMGERNHCVLEQVLVEKSINTIRFLAIDVVEKSSGKWTIGFKLSGKAKGATMNVSFGYMDIGTNSVPLGDNQYGIGLLSADLLNGQVYENTEVKKQVARLNPYGKWVGENMRSLKLVNFLIAIVLDNETILRCQQVFGYSSKHVQMIIEIMAAQGKEPTSCMGDDIPLAILSQKPHMLYDYFKQCFSTYQFACLIRYGASAICPYLALGTCRQWRLSAKTVSLMRNEKMSTVTIEQAQTKFCKEIKYGLLKILSKIGISLLSSYCDAQIFEIYGLKKEMVDLAFYGSVSKIGGLTFDELARETLSFLGKASSLSNSYVHNATIIIELLFKLENCRNNLPSRFRMQPIKFEKEDDTNYHMYLIAVLANMRGRNYSIHEVDKLKAKFIVGRIIPAIATSTTMATCLICLELYKVFEALHLIVSLGIVLAMDKFLKKVVVAAAIKFSSALFGMFCIFSVLVILDTTVPVAAASLMNFFELALMFIPRWLPLFYVSTFVGLPLSVRDIPASSCLKICFTIVGGWLASLCVTGFIAIAVKKIVKTKMIDVEPTEKPFLFSPIEFWTWAGIFLVSFVSAIFSPTALGTSARTCLPFLLAFTVLGYMVGFGLPSNVKKSFSSNYVLCTLDRSGSIGLWVLFTTKSCYSCSSILHPILVDKNVLKGWVLMQTK